MDRCLHGCLCGHPHIAGRGRRARLTTGHRRKDAHSPKAQTQFVLSDQFDIRISSGRRTFSKARAESLPPATSPIGACVSSSTRAEHDGSLSGYVGAYGLPSGSDPSKIREHVYLFQSCRFEELLNLCSSITSFQRSGESIELVVNTGTERIA